MYSYTIQYRLAKQMTHVDALSRLPLNIAIEVEESSINRFCITNDFNLSTKEIPDGYKTDKILEKVIKYAQEGWPNNIEEDLEYYFKLRDNLGTQDNCLFFGDSIIIPESIREEILKLLHKDHHGIVRMKMEGRGIVWWRGMAKNVEHFVKGCEICCQTQSVPKEKVESKWLETNSPFERVHIDFFYFYKDIFLLFVDSYSKFIDVKLMNKTNVERVIYTLQEIFAYFGLPTELVADNGLPSNSWKFNTYGKESNIKVTKTPPYHSQSNG
ncbi:uncharacterized protein K02A2.6-like [Daktulosphaira vitifoliae]|uniref:uncharacterized protein K02A2.6-like n=1 Tax=Daktulosphaira vitifoliae TaxID=58002 RepID=UPI0021AAC4AE|nr:uncharacterized protein K02A2.6-like [Daktulosphaira vitifoliae]